MWTLADICQNSISRRWYYTIEGSKMVNKTYEGGVGQIWRSGWENILETWRDTGFFSFIFIFLFSFEYFISFNQDLFGITPEMKRAQKLNRWSMFLARDPIAQLCVTRWWSCVLGQFGKAMVGTWWNWVSIWWLWLILDGPDGQAAQKLNSWSMFPIPQNHNWKNKQRVFAIFLVS